jgi:hypothetical protein
MRGLAFILVLSIVGCGGSELSFTPLQAAPRQLYARMGAQVELFLAARPTRQFVEIGMIESDGSSDDQATLLAEMRGIAGQHGCDGLIILGANETNAASGALAAPRATEAYRGSCIVYTAPAEAAAAPVAAAAPPMPSAPSAPSALAPVAPAPTPPPVPVVTTTAPVAATQITTASKPAAASCQPDAIVSCYGIGGCSGTQRCAADGSRYSPCACTQAATATH